MKISDVIELAKAGYKPADVFKLLEYVEHSPAVKEAAPDIKPEDVPDNTPEPTPEPEVKPEVKEVDTDGSVLDKLFE